MPEYKPYIADPDDYSMKPADLHTPSYIIKKVEWQRYFRKYNVSTEEEYDEWRKKLDLQFANRESNWFQQLMGKAWFDGILPLVRKHLTPKQIFYYLSKLDKFASLMPNDFFRKALKVIDAGAEFVYKRMK